MGTRTIGAGVLGQKLVQPWLRRLAHRPQPVAPVSPAPSEDLTFAILEARWEPRPEEWHFLIDLEVELCRRPGAQVVLLTGDHPSRLGTVLAAVYPGLAVRSVDTRLDPRTLSRTSAGWDHYDVIIDETRSIATRETIFRSAWEHLVPGGLYVIHDTGLNRWPLLIEMISSRGEEPIVPAAGCSANDHWPGRSLGWVKLGTEHLIMENRLGG